MVTPAGTPSGLNFQAHSEQPQPRKAFISIHAISRRIPGGSRPEDVTIHDSLAQDVTPRDVDFNSTPLANGTVRLGSLRSLAGLKPAATTATLRPGPYNHNAQGHDLSCPYAASGIASGSAAWCW